MRDELKGVYELIDEIEIAMLTTRRRDGHLESRATATQMRASGADLWLVTSEATQKLQAQGMKVEAIDLRCLKPMDTETLVKSVQKTKYLLSVDQSYYTLCPGAEVIARVAENVVGARFKRVAFPDAPPPASPEMFVWMRPNADNVVKAALKLVG